MKDIGKPCALIAHARFDEGGQAYQAMAGLFRHRQTKGAETDKLNLMSYAPVLYSRWFPISNEPCPSHEGQGFFLFSGAPHVQLFRYPFSHHHLG